MGPCFLLCAVAMTTQGLVGSMGLGGAWGANMVDITG